MVKFISRHNKDYSRYNILREFVKDVALKNDIYILFPFSKNQFIKNFFKRERIINDFFISNYDTYVYDRKKISKYNPRAWWKYIQDRINFKCSKYLLSDTHEHFSYWEQLFGKFSGKLFVLPVFADTQIYYPSKEIVQNDKIKILFFGSFIPLHGIDVILRAFKLLEEKEIVFEANIIGNGQTFSAMKRLFDQLGLKNVSMKGDLLSEDRLADEIRKFDIILGIFGDSKKAFSVVPNKIYQALACKKALITMKSNAIDEFFNEEHLMSCANSPIELAKNIEILINNPAKRVALADNGHKRFYELYTDKKKEFIDFINQIDIDIETIKGIK